MFISYIKENEVALDEIRPLWEKLRSHHHEKTRDFKKRFSSMTFESRKNSILENTNGCLVEFARNNETGDYVGYCVSTLYKNGNGEIDSLYVDPEYRGKRIADRLVNDAIEWLHSRDVKEINIYVAAGNEEVFGFYERFGFRPFVMLLKQNQ